MGGFAIGTAEFVTMGLLPEVADGVGVSIPSAGHVISAYAVGVVVGAPVMALLAARWPRRGLLIGLMAAYALFNALSAVAGDLQMLVLARFLDGLPHAAYFGVASLVAADLAAPGRKGRAIASVMLGLSVANVVGVPAATWMGQALGWRSAYWAVAGLALLTVALVIAFIPRGPATSRRPVVASSPRCASRRCGSRCWPAPSASAACSRSSPTSPDRHRGGWSGQGAVPVFLLAFGLGMVAGTWIAGEMADWSVFRSLVIGSVGMAVSLLAFWLLAPLGWALLPVAFLITFLGSVLVVNLQLRLMDVAGDAQNLGAAMNHASLNVANALGAWIGGVVIASGLGLRAPALAGVGLAVAGLVVILISAVVARRTPAGPAG